MKSKLMKIKMLLMDVDGVLTDGDIIYTSEGDELKKFNVQDGMGITLARLAGLKTGIITSRESELVKRRAGELKFDVIEQGCKRKLKEYENIKKKFNFEDENIAYMGDDIPDMSILNRAGYSIAPANARDEVKAVCDYVTVQPGGQGAVREVIDKILKLQDKFYSILEELAEK